MRKLCWWAMPCAGAVFLAVYLLPEALLLPAGAFCALCAIAALLFRGKLRVGVALAALGLAAGFFWTGCYALLFRAPAHALVSDAPGSYTLLVTGFPTGTDRGASLPARLLLENAPDCKVQLYAEADALDLRPGDLVSASLRLTRSDFLRGQAFDYYQSKGIYLLGYAQEPLVLIRRPETPPVSTWPQYAAHGLQASVSRSFPADLSGFVATLLTGNKALLPDGLSVALQRSGLAHVAAVSGLHVSFLVGLLTTLLKKRSPVSAAVTLAAVFFFAALAGNSPSALRAAFLCAFLLLAPLLGREEDRPTALAAALLLLLLPCPYAASSVSLQLSFAAVAGIYLITGDLNARWVRRIPRWTSPPGKLFRRVLLFCSGTLATTLGALLFTLPLTALHFHSVSLAGPLSNLLTLWAVSGVFLGGLITALTGLFCPPAAALLGWVFAWPARWAVWVAQQIARLPFASIPLLSPFLAVWFLLSYAILLLWLLARRRMRPVIPLAALTACLCAALVVDSWSILTGTLTVTAMDVGQGASTLFYSQGRTLLVDCGGNGGDNAGDIAADHLQRLGLSHLDALVLTHCHSDHANGVPELLRRVDVSLLLLPDTRREEPLRQDILSLAAQRGCQVEIIQQDADLTFGSASLRIFAPLGDGGVNEEGLSLLCTAGDFDVLLTGDMNDVVERRLVKYKDLPDIELLLVGHHGSKSSTSEELLLATRPETAVISCGYNTYGHPAPETLERLGAAGCQIYLTQDMGDVTVTINQKEGTQ